MNKWSESIKIMVSWLVFRSEDKIRGHGRFSIDFTTILRVLFEKFQFKNSQDADKTLPKMIRCFCEWQILLYSDLCYTPKILYSVLYTPKPYCILQSCGRGGRGENLYTAPVTYIVRYFTLRVITLWFYIIRDNPISEMFIEVSVSRVIMCVTRRALIFTANHNCFRNIDTSASRFYYHKKKKSPYKIKTAYMLFVY